MDYLLHIAIMIMIYSIAGMSLNLLAGYTGLLSIAHAGFYGIGAYSAALLSLNYETSFLIALSMAVTIASITGLTVGYLSLRVQGDMFVITTFGFQIVILSIMDNWVELTGGPLGLRGIPTPSFGSLSINSNLGFFLIAFTFGILVFLFCSRLVASPLGNVLRAIREDELLAQTFGKRTWSFKLLSFATGAGIAGLAGALYAFYFSYIDPTSFTITESIFMLAIVIVGGAGRLEGPILGAIILVALPELIRLAKIPNAIAANLREILYGALLILFMMFRPQGLLGRYTFRTR